MKTHLTTMGVPSSLEDLKSRNLYVSLVAEFLGIFFLVFIGCGSCIHYPGNWVGIGLTFGLTAATMVWNIGHISGCHINTAITFGFLITRKISPLRAVFYMIVQLIGAIVAAAVLKGVLNPTSNLTHHLAANLGTSAPNIGVTLGQAFGIELLITFVLVFTVFSTCDGLRVDHRGSGALAIGFSLTLSVIFAAPLTGAGMNPARVFGPALISNTWTAHWVYWIAPLIGSGAAALLYDFVFAVNATTAKARGFLKAGYDDCDFDQNGAKIKEQSGAVNQSDVPPSVGASPRNNADVPFNEIRSFLRNIAKRGDSNLCGCTSAKGADTDTEVQYQPDKPGSFS